MPFIKDPVKPFICKNFPRIQLLIDVINALLQLITPRLIWIIIARFDIIRVLQRISVFPVVTRCTAVCVRTGLLLLTLPPYRAADTK
jgi:hypothetical protein